MKKLSTFLILALMACISVMAQNEAKIGDVQYATLREAVTAANGSSDPVTITLLETINDVNAESIEFNNNNALVTLDLNGNGIVLTKGNAIVTGKLKLMNSESTRSGFSTGTQMTLIYVKGTGELDIDATNMRIYSANRTIYVDPNATLTIDGGQTDPKSLGYYQIESREAACVENWGTSTVKNAKMTSTGEYGRCFLSKQGTLEITNIWALTTYYNVLKLEDGSGNVTVNDSYFECQNFSGTINNSSTKGTLTLNNLQCYNKNVSGWHYNHADHRAIYGATGSKTVINGGKYWSDINQAISTDGELIATDMTITTRPLRGLANAKLTLNNCNITVGNFTAIDVTANTPVKISGGTYQSSTHIMTVPSGEAVYIRDATFKSTSASATMFVCTQGADLTLYNCVLSTAGTAVQLAEDNILSLAGSKVTAQTPLSAPDLDEGQTIADKNITLVIDNTVFSSEPDAQLLPSGYVSFRNSDPSTAADYPYTVLSCLDAFAAYKAGAAAYARGMKDESYPDATNERLEQIAQQIEAMEYDNTKTYAEQTAAIENLLGNIDGLYVAVIGDVKYLTLSAAIQAANISSADVTIQLVNSFADDADDLSVNNTNGKAITLDLNGKSFTLKKNGIDIRSVLYVLNSSDAKSTATISGVSGAFLFRANNGGELNINGTNCSFVGANSNSRIVVTAGTGTATVDGGNYSANHNCFRNESEGLMVLKNLTALTNKQVTIDIINGTANLDNVKSSVSGISNALYVEEHAGKVVAVNSTFTGNNNASVVKVYSKADNTLTLDNCEVNNNANWSSPAEDDYNCAIYIDEDAHIVVTNDSYIHSLTNRPVRSLGYVESDKSTFEGYYGFKVEGTSAKAELSDCNLSARYKGAFVITKNSSPNNETSINGGEFSATNDYVFNIGAGNKIKIDGITMSGTGYGLYTAGDVTVSNSILGSSVSAVRITGAGKATLKDCQLAATAPLAKESDSNNHSVTCEGTVIANNIIDELMLQTGMVCGANTDSETSTQYPYVAKLGTVAFNEYRGIVKPYIEGYKTQYSAPALMNVIDQQLAALDAMTYHPDQVFAYQAAEMLNKAKNVASALMDIIQGGETDQSVVDMVALVKENINAATDINLLDAAKNDGTNAIINARKAAVEAEKIYAKGEIDNAVGTSTQADVLAAAAAAKQAIDAAQTTTEVIDAMNEGIHAISVITSVVGVETENAPAVYDLNGTRLSSAKSTGIYIIGNKKVAVSK